MFPEPRISFCAYEILIFSLRYKGGASKLEILELPQLVNKKKSERMEVAYSLSKLRSLINLVSIHDSGQKFFVKRTMIELFSLLV